MMNEFLITIFKLLEKGVGLVFDKLTQGFDALHGERERYSSRFVPAWEVLTERPTGLNLTGRRGLSLERAMQHALIVGRSGVGKSSVSVLSELLTATDRTRKSYCVLDPSGELHARSSGYLNSIGFRVIKLDFGDPESPGGRFNPLERATTPTSIRMVASAVTRNALGQHASDPFWNTAAQTLLGNIFQLLRSQPDPEVRNLANAAYLLTKMQSAPDEFDLFASRFADEETFDQIKALYASGEKLRASITATASAALSSFTDPAVALMTARDNIDFASLRATRTAFFITCPTLSSAHFQVLVNVLFEQLFTSLMSKLPKEDDLPVVFLLDEFSSVVFPSMPLVVQNARKFSIALALYCQSEASLVEAYGKSDATTIIGNCWTRVFFTAQDLNTSRNLEETLGRAEEEDERGAKRIVPLMTRENIRLLSERRAIVLCGNKEPVLARLVPYYRRRRLRLRSLIPPVVMEADGETFKRVEISQPHVEPEAQKATPILGE